LHSFIRARTRSKTSFASCSVLQCITKYENANNEKHIEIPANTFAPGIYFIQSNSVNIGKIVIE